MTRLDLPLAPPLWELALLKATRRGMRELLGAPHFTETDSTRTAGGEEDAWAYALPSGQRLLIILQVPYQTVRLAADPPEIGPVLRVLGIGPDDAGLQCYPAPFPLC